MISFFLHKRYFFVSLIAFALGPYMVCAQFAGGDAGGYSSITISNSVCFSSGPNPFGGGSASGFSNTSIINSVCSSSGPNAFGGGNGGGNGSISVTNSVCSATGPSAFGGGNGDGNGSVLIVNSVCFAAGPNAFGGGSGDGTGILGISNSVCSAAGPNAFGGGDADGISVGSISNSVCSAAGPNPFGGGSSDGIAYGSVGSAVCSVTSFNPFGGGSSGGYASIQEIAVDPASCGTPLPIELIHFDAYIQQDVVLLTWTTASETNNDYFTIEKSLDGNTFVDIKEIDGAGNSSATLQYQWADQEPTVGLAYYRLKQTDFDGAFSHSPIVTVLYDGGNPFQLQLYPNPIRDGLLQVEFNQPVCEEMSLSLKDLAGKHILSNQVCLEDRKTAEVDFKSNPPRGIYFLTLSCEGYSVTRKVLFD